MPIKTQNMRYNRFVIKLANIYISPRLSLNTKTKYRILYLVFLYDTEFKINLLNLCRYCYIGNQGKILIELKSELIKMRLDLHITIRMEL